MPGTTARSLVLEGDRALVMTREFEAPRELVFKAFTDPAAIPRWWGPRYLTTTVDRMDVRPGGAWRFLQRDADGNEFAFHGEYLTVEPPSRLVYTFEFEGMPGHVTTETLSFEERDGRTVITDHVLFETPEDREGMIASGMEAGSNESMERLAEYLAAQR